MLNAQSNSEKALALLTELRKQKAQLTFTQSRIKELEKHLAAHKVDGDLDDFTKEENPNTIQHDGVTFIYSPGKTTYDFSECEEVQELKEELEALKNAYAESGLATKKQGKPFWTVKS